jgi:hypothetical protein
MAGEELQALASMAGYGRGYPNDFTGYDVPGIAQGAKEVRICAFKKW